MVCPHSQQSSLLAPHSWLRPLPRLAACSAEGRGCLRPGWTQGMSSSSGARTSSLDTQRPGKRFKSTYLASGPHPLAGSGLLSPSLELNRMPGPCSCPRVWPGKGTSLMTCSSLYGRNWAGWGPEQLLRAQNAWGARQRALEMSGGMPRARQESPE